MQGTQQEVGGAERIWPSSSSSSYLSSTSPSYNPPPPSTAEHHLHLTADQQQLDICSSGCLTVIGGSAPLISLPPLELNTLFSLHCSNMFASPSSSSHFNCLPVFSRIVKFCLIPHSALPFYYALLTRAKLKVSRIFHHHYCRGGVVI